MLVNKIKVILHSDLTPEQKEQSLKALIPLWTVQDIETAVCAHFEITHDLLKSKTKIPRIVKGRHILRYLLSQYGFFGSGKLAEAYGYERTSCYKSIKIVNGYIEVGDDVVKDIEAIKSKLVS
jgi:chromosomal replication initiation ATPase DnaA